MKEYLFGGFVVVCICPSSQHNVVDKRQRNDTKSTSNPIRLFASSFNSHSLPTLLSLCFLFEFLLVVWRVDSCYSIENEWQSNYGVNVSDTGSSGTGCFQISTLSSNFYNYFLGAREM